MARKRTIAIRHPELADEMRAKIAPTCPSRSPRPMTAPNRAPTGRSSRAALEDGTDVRLAGQLPPIGGPVRAYAEDVPGVLPCRLPARRHAPAVMNPVREGTHATAGAKAR